MTFILAELSTGELSRSLQVFAILLFMTKMSGTGMSNTFRLKNIIN